MITTFYFVLFLLSFVTAQISVIPQGVKDIIQIVIGVVAIIFFFFVK